MARHRIHLAARLQALEKRQIASDQVPMQSVFARYYTRPIPTISSLVSADELRTVPHEQIRARLLALRPPVAAEFKDLGPQELFDLARHEVIRSKSIDID